MPSQVAPIVADPTSQSLVLGVDVCDKRLDLALCDGRCLESVDFDPAGIKKLLALFVWYHREKRSRESSDDLTYGIQTDDINNRISCLLLYHVSRMHCGFTNQQLPLRKQLL